MSLSELQKLKIEVERLTDVAEIKDLKAKYCRIVDGLVATRCKEPIAELATVFTDDAVADFGPAGRLEGIANLTAFFAEMMPAQRRWMWHSVHTPLIVVAGDVATGQWTIVARTSEGEAGTELVYGRYEDQYRRTVDGWRTSSLNFYRESH